MGVILKLHTWAGLATFVNFVIYGIVGMAAVFAPSPDAPEPAAVVREIPFTVAPNLSDREVALQVLDLLDLPLAKPLQNFAIQHDREGRLVLDFRLVEFMNSSTIKAFVVWITRILDMPSDAYLVRFVALADQHWFRRTLDAFCCFSPEHVSLELQ